MENKFPKNTIKHLEIIQQITTIKQFKLLNKKVKKNKKI
jgi:hypothetical protein